MKVNDDEVQIEEEHCDMQGFSRKDTSSRLKIEPWQNRLLNSLLVVICLLCACVYVWFSIDWYSSDQIMTLQQRRVSDMGLNVSLAKHCLLSDCSRFEVYVSEDL